MNESAQLTHRRVIEGREYQGIPIHAAEGIHEFVAELLMKHAPPGKSPHEPGRTTVLDIAAGSGALSRRLADSGYEVQSNEFDLSSWSLPHENVWSIDLNAEIPAEYATKQFDAVVAVEVIEHLENPLSFLRICQQFTRPGGTIILSTPNIVESQSLVRFLGSGKFYHFNPEAYHSSGHITLLPFWMLESHIKQIGLKIAYRGTAGRMPKRWTFSLAASLIHSAAQTLTRRSIPNDIRSGAAITYVVQKP